MNILFSVRSWADCLYWQQTDKQLVKKINELLKEISRNSHSGIGKPEPLQFAQSGYWSRRISEERRLVYKGDGETLKVAQARYHYE
jgi:toxin YoeB